MSASGQTRKRKSDIGAGNDAPVAAASPKKSERKVDVEDGPRWLSANPSKRVGEIFYLCYMVFWVTAFGAGIVWTGAYHHWNDWGYNTATLALMIPTFIIPIFFPFGADKALPWYSRYAVKANFWIIPFNFVGNWFWTHYFFALLGAAYTFPVKYLWNEVPPMCYFLTQIYFQTYFTLASVVIRRFALHHKNRFVRWILIAVITLVLSWTASFMETFTIESVPYYSFVDRSKMYLVGTWFYALYFIVGFPFYVQLDEKPGENTSLGYFVLQSLAAAQLVFILCDFWRVIVGNILADMKTNTLPWLMKYFTSGSQ
eukprot:TRINITY_DN10677_c0_g1_i1.p1 TRINITY_DN10677_c0_g1~~TRINITY_DN10677_c0_g1_i1.p1  ORF type:complete len:314 (-),score=49.75 TRINITY_DN10677_c0_g1_i1:36-977(-)